MMSFKISLLIICLLLIFGCASKPKKSPPIPEQATVTVEKPLLQQVLEHYGPVVAERVRYWQQLINTADERSDEENLKITNDFFNGARFLEDQQVWNRKDYWATPLEFIIMDAGDCEDFSCAKYFTLKQMGIDPNKLRLVYVKATNLNKAHMVLAYYPELDGEPLLLDNLQQQISPASKRQDLTPVYSFNGSDMWLAKTRNQQVKAKGKAYTLKDWVAWQARLEDGMPVLLIPDF